MMTVDEIDEKGIRTRLRDSFYEKSTSILAMENNQVAGRIEYHFYGCMQGGYRMAYVNLQNLKKTVKSMISINII